MGPALARDTEINASLHPLGTMGRETAAAMPVLSQEMGEFMEQGFLHLFL